MRRLLLLLVPSVLALPPAAQAAQVTTDRRCYVQSETKGADGQLTPVAPSVRLDGTQFPALQPYTVALDGTQLQGGAGTMSATGAMTGTLTAPALDADTPEQAFTIAVAAAGVSAQTTFTVTRLLADYTPGSGSPQGKVRFSVHGFALRDENDKAADPTPDVYLHYIRPNGKLRLTLRLGTAHGACGTIERTRKRRLFPFRPERGTWKLQFDTSRSFRKGTDASDFLFYTASVRITKAA